MLIPLHSFGTTSPRETPTPPPPPTPLTVGVDATEVIGEATGYSGVLFTDIVTCSASGGTAPYSYSWTRASGDGAMFASAPTSAATAFARTGSYVNNYTSYWNCTVTDAADAVATTQTVSATVYFWDYT